MIIFPILAENNYYCNMCNENNKIVDCGRRELIHLVRHVLKS